VTLHKPKSGER